MGSADVVWGVMVSSGSEQHWVMAFFRK